MKRVRGCNHSKPQWQPIEAWYPSQHAAAADPWLLDDPCPCARRVRVRGTWGDRVAISGNLLRTIPVLACLPVQAGLRLLEGVHRGAVRPMQEQEGLPKRQRLLRRTVRSVPDVAPRRQHAAPHGSFSPNPIKASSMSYTGVGSSPQSPFINDTKPRPSLGR